MKNTALRIFAIALAALSLTACDSLHNLIATPPADFTGKYADTQLVLGDVCGTPRDAEMHISVDTLIAEDDTSLHEFTADVVIYGAGEDGATVTAGADWSVSGASKNYNSGFVPGFGTVSLAPSEEGFAGTATIHDVTCIQPGVDGAEDVTTHERVTFEFNAKQQ